MEFCVGIIDDDNGFVELRTVEEVFSRMFPDHYSEIVEYNIFDAKGEVRWEKIEKMITERYMDLECRGIFTELTRVENMFDDLKRVANWARWKQ